MSHYATTFGQSHPLFAAVSTTEKGSTGPRAEGAPKVSVSSGSQKMPAANTSELTAHSSGGAKEKAIKTPPQIKVKIKAPPKVKKRKGIA